MDRLARIPNAPWVNFGDVTHVAAAEALVNWLDVGVQPTEVTVETRDDNTTGPVFQHRVAITRQVRATPLRHDPVDAK